MRLSTIIRSIENALFGSREPDTAAQRSEKLRKRGVRVGENCEIYAVDFSTEPYLVELGNRVGISGGTKFVTHDGIVWFIRDRRPTAQVLGRIKVGDGTFIGESCIILPGTTIGKDCIIGAGAVVRGEIPDNSIVIGNPGRVVGRASLLVRKILTSPNTLDTHALPEPEREAVLRRHFGVPPDAL